jgi:light-regulated signal transduction histidine kinase (bacteriophytochrome)
VSLGVNGPDVPAFGQADLTNCEREPIHLAGAVQPHGALLVLRAADLVVLQASRNVGLLLGVPLERCRGRALTALGGDLAARVGDLRDREPLAEAVALQCKLAGPAGPRPFEGALHRLDQLLLLELEPVDGPAPGMPAPVALAPDVLGAAIADAVQRISAAPSIGLLADAVVQVLRELTGYDRVMVYKFDPDGHGHVIAEARHPRLESLLGHHYPASDIPQRARALYLRNRVRMLVDVDAEAAPIEPVLRPDNGQPLDLSLAALRSMSPIHLQYLRNMGVTATLTASLVRDGQLWGLIAAHHYAPRCLRLALRSAADLLAEVASTRIGAIENYAHAQVALMVRRLEQRLVEATSAEGDWQQALMRSPRTLLQPLEATGAVLCHEGELLTAGETPSTPELRALIDWVRTQPASNEPWCCDAIGNVHPPLRSLTPTASGVLAVRLSTDGKDWLIWLRKEQLQSITWAGDPTKPTVGDDPLQLSPRRSFAAWSEIVRGTAVPWSTTEVALARAIGVALVDIIVQVQAVRLLIAEHQRARIRAAVAGSREAVLVCDPQGQVLFANAMAEALCGRTVAAGVPASTLFAQPQAVQQAFDRLRGTPQTWRRELALQPADGAPFPAMVRVEVVHGRERRPLGMVLTLQDLRAARHDDAARAQFESSLRAPHEADEVVAAILTNASLAAMDIAETRNGPPVAPLLRELEASTRRAAALYAQIRAFNG